MWNKARQSFILKQSLTFGEWMGLLWESLYKDWLPQDSWIFVPKIYIQCRKKGSGIKKSWIWSHSKILICMCHLFPFIGRRLSSAWMSTTAMQQNLSSEKDKKQFSHPFCFALSLFWWFGFIPSFGYYILTASTILCFLLPHVYISTSWSLYFFCHLSPLVSFAPHSRFPFCLSLILRDTVNLRLVRGLCYNIL